MPFCGVQHTRKTNKQTKCARKGVPTENGTHGPIYTRLEFLVVTLGKAHNSHHASKVYEMVYNEETGFLLPRICTWIALLIYVSNYLPHNVPLIISNCLL